MISWVVRRTVFPSTMLASIVLWGTVGCRAVWADEQQTCGERVSIASVRVEWDRLQLLASMMTDAQFRSWGLQLHRAQPSSLEPMDGWRRSVGREAESVALNALWCQGWRQRRAASPLGQCPSAIVARVKQWSPDALVVRPEKLALRPACGSGPARVSQCAA